MKLLALVPVHTSLPVAGLSIGSFLREHRKYSVDVHVGVHSNYSDYTQDLSLFEELKGIATVHKVDEIDWLGEYNTCFYRYSVMHAKNLENLMKKTADLDFDYAVFLDHDLLVKTDFVTRCLNRFPDADLIGTLHDDKDKIWPFVTMAGQRVNCLPKVSIWHLLISKKLFKGILGNPSLIYPKLMNDVEKKSFTEEQPGLEDLPLFVDTFSEVLQLCRRTKAMKIGVVKTAEFAQWVSHFYNSSFNYGSRTRGDYPAHVAEIEKIYRREFPQGLREFREDEETVERIHRNLLKALVMVAEQHATIVMNTTVDLPATVRDREIERLSTALMVAKAMCVAAGVKEEAVRTVAELAFQKEKQAWESFVLARGK